MAYISTVADPVPGTRPITALQDAVLSVQLAVFFVLWLGEASPGKIAADRRLFHLVYAANLLGASLWCANGVYIHLQEPLPQESTLPWQTFLALGAVTPVLFPLVCCLALFGTTSKLSRRMMVVSVSVATGFASAVLTSADLSLGGLLPSTLVLTPWHVADGRSYGGEGFGIPFDLMTSYPCYRGDSLFVLSSLFLVMNFVSVLILSSAPQKIKAEMPEQTQALEKAARRLCIAVASMLGNCIVLLYLVVVFKTSLRRAFDVFHAVQGIVMAVCFFEFRGIIRVTSSITVGNKDN